MEKVYKIILENAISGNLSEKEAFETIKLLKYKQREGEKDIAVIGISVNLPMAKNIEEFWSVIGNRMDCVKEIPEGRRKDADDLLRCRGMNPESMEYQNLAYLDEIDKFDCNFFEISPQEADFMDPNQRLFLQAAWNAIEDAGYGGKKIRGTKTGVYVGFCGESEYGRVISETQPESLSLAVAGNVTPFIASRISYVLDLKGPGVLVNTACSSSLAAVHYACQGIRNGECDMAIAGSVKISLAAVQSGFKLGTESTDARTRSFDDSSDGMGGGEGVAAIILKPLAKALEDRDNIYAVIKGSSVNQDGYSNGITAPNPMAQAEAIKTAWKEAGIDPETIAYIEAHGTGTRLGDPVEIDGIQKAFRDYTSKSQFCALSTVKTNIGHLDNAAGIVGLVKAVLALRYKEIPPSLHFNRPNRTINFINSPVYINNRLRKWTVDDMPRRCGVSSFGLSGTNCHMILEEAPGVAYDNPENPGELNVLALSAKTEDSLVELINRYKDYAKEIHNQDLKNICYTANTGRDHYNYRAVIVLEEGKSLKQKLDELDLTDTQGERKAWGEICENEKKNLSRNAAVKMKEFLDSGKQDKEALRNICDLYVRGAEIEWDTLYKDDKIRKVRIPVYPFARQRCWIDLSDSCYEKCSASSELKAVTPKRIKKRDKALLKKRNLSGSDYVEPRSDTEKILAELWQDILGYESIGVHDNFFELGGHSLLAVNLTSKIKAIFNKQITLQCFNENSTVEKLARFLDGDSVGSADSCKASQGIVSGEVELAPVQRCFFSKNFTDPQHWTGSILLYREEGFDEGIIRNVFAKITEHHDALRLVFKKERDKIIQYNRGIEGKLFDLEIVDLMDDPDAEAKIQEIGYKLQNSIDLSEGPLLRMNLFRTKNGDHLLIASHHLAADGYSMTIILEDFATGYKQALENQEIKFQEKTVSFKDWSKQISLRANSKEFIEKELDYWSALEETGIAELPKDNRLTGPSCSKDSNEKIDVLLDEPEVERLVRDVNRKYGTNTLDILLTGLGLAIREWTGEDKVLVRLGGHGRDVGDGTLNIARTVGWFGISYPVILDISKYEDLPSQIAMIRDTLGNIPGKGEGYDMLRYVTPPEKTCGKKFKLNPEIYVNNLGNVDQFTKTGAAVFKTSALTVPPARSLYCEREYTLNFSTHILNGKLILGLEYDKNEYREETVLKIIDYCRKNLRRLLDEA